ncbi:MAG: DUF6034 family protein [Clostridiaceae bacterium]
MKKITCVLLAALLLPALIACQKTPESPIVVGKDTSVLIDKAQTEESQQKTDISASVDLYSRLNAPETYAVDLASKGGKLSVHVDAAVELPDQEIPIYRVQAAEFSTEQSQLIAEILMGNDAHYVDIEGANIKTKGMYQREIDKLRAALDDWENTGIYLYDMVYNTKEEAEQALEAMFALAAAAPETLPEIIPYFGWRTPNVSNENGPVETTDSYLMLFAMPDDATVSRLDIENSRDTGSSARVLYWRDTEMMFGRISTDEADVSSILDISEDDAFAIAQNAIDQMQLADFVCSAKQAAIYKLDVKGATTKPVYDFMFTRQLSGVTETYTNADESGTDGYSKPWQYEKVHVLVDEEGIFYLEYDGPTTIKEKVMGATALLPFEEIRSTFERMAVIVDNSVDSSGVDGASEKRVITVVRLGLMCIREQNSDTGLLVPVWDFLGYSERTSPNEGTLLFDTNELESFLAINAIDGSIIDRASGY